MAHDTFRLRPLGVGDLLDETVRLYRRHFALFVGIAACVFIPAGLVGFVQQLALLGGQTPVMVGLFSLLPAPVLGLANLAMSLAMIYAVSELYLGRNPTIGRAYSGGFRRFGGALGLSLLAGLALGLLAITILGIPVAVYFGVCWSVALPALLLEGVGIRRAMGRSRGLVKGGWWRVLGIVILIGIIQFVIQWFFSFLGTLLGIFASGDLTVYAAASTIAGTIGQIAGSPILYCGLVLLYYDLRIRKEGFDLELLAQAMEGRGPEEGVPQAALE